MPYDDLTDEQLESLMREGVTAEPPPPQAAEPEPVAEQAAPPPEAPPAEEAQPDAPAPEPEVDLEKVRLEALIEEMNARQRAQDAKLGKFAGEADYWRRQAEQARQAPPPEPDAYVRDDPPQAPPPQATPRSDPTAAWVMRQAASTGMMEFAGQNPDAADLAVDMQAYLEANGYGNGAIVTRSSNPEEAQREAYRAMSEAYWHVKSDRATKTRLEVEQKRADQFTRQKEAKARASISGSGAAPVPREAPKTLQTMTDKELEAEMDRRFQSR